MIVAGPEGFAKSQYRKFNIRTDNAAPGDDLAMMREVLRRRFHRLIKEAGPRPEAPLENGAEEGASAWPDLVLIDGGKGQLSAALDILAELGINDLPVVAVAKGRDREAGRETFHQPGRSPFTLPPRDPVLYFIQRLRDEAHRFAIGGHRTRRAKAMQASPLDEVPGIGPTRKRALLRHFGSAKEVGRAGMEDLRAVEGISENMARAVYEHFHERAG
jgi:excinuclease ABC subunit C